MRVVLLFILATLSLSAVQPVRCRVVTVSPALRDNLDDRILTRGKWRLRGACLDVQRQTEELQKIDPGRIYKIQITGGFGPQGQITDWPGHLFSNSKILCNESNAANTIRTDPISIWTPAKACVEVLRRNPAPSLSPNK